MPHDTDFPRDTQDSAPLPISSRPLSEIYEYGKDLLDPDFQPIVRKYLRDVIGPNSKSPQVDVYDIYVFRHHDKVVYVGRSVRPHERVRQHCGVASNWNAQSLLQYYIMDSDPLSDAWTVEFWCHDCCAEIVARQLPGFHHYDESIAEVAMIRELQPSMNVQHVDY